MDESVRSPSVSFGVSLRQRVLKAGAWAVLALAVSMIIRLAGNLLMTRLLAPDLFGVMAMTGIVMNALVMFSDLGLKQSIIQSSRGDDPVFLDTAWSVQMLRGALLCGGAIAVSLGLATAVHLHVVPSESVYADPRLPYVVAVMSICFVIGSFTSTKVFEASRKLSLGRLAQIEVAGQAAGLVCSIAWAVFDRSIWALVAGAILSTAVKMLLSHTCMPGSANRLRWDKPAFLELARFSRWIFISSILGFMSLNGDRLLLGAVVDTAVLGVYAIASLLSGTIEQVLMILVGEIVFPALSEVARERRSELKTRYYHFHFMIALPAYFAGGALMVSGQATIDLLYDRRYADAGWMLEILAAALLAVPVRTAQQMFLALGKPRILSILATIRLATVLTGVPICFTLFGVPGALWAVTLSQFAGVPVIVFTSARHGLFDLQRELLALPLVGAGMVAGKVFAAAMGY